MEDVVNIIDKRKGIVYNEAIIPLYVMIRNTVMTTNS
jgi:hypothetical protein